MHTQKLWFDACKPDANLGDAEIGPAPHKIAHGSAQRVLEAMNVKHNGASFLEFGSGHGLVCFSAVLDHGAVSAVGIEMRQRSHEWAKAALARLKRYTPKPLEIAFWNGNILELEKATSDTSGTLILGYPTHIYSFDFDYPPKVLYAIARILYSMRDTWQVFASANDTKDWLTTLRELAAPEDLLGFFERHFRQRPKNVGVTLVGSRSRHTIYLFDNTLHASPTITPLAVGEEKASGDVSRAEPDPQAL